MKKFDPIFFFPQDSNIKPDWKKITSEEELNEYYYINSQSKIFSSYSSKILSESYNHAGYKVVSLNKKDGTRIQRKPHRLSMIEFNKIENYNSLEVNHKNGIKTDNNIENLEWCTPKENIKHAIDHNLRTTWKRENNPKVKINEEIAYNIGISFINGKSIKDIMKDYPFISYNIVRNIVLGKNWSNLFTMDQLNLMNNIYCMRSSTIES